MDPVTGAGAARGGSGRRAICIPTAAGADRRGRRTRSVLAVATLALALAGCSFDLTPSATDEVTAISTSEAAAAASLISAYRVAHGLPAVSVDSRLNDAAVHQARAVAQAGALSHGDFTARMGRYGIRGAAAENLTAGPGTVSEAVARWKASPGHNENLLMPEARRIGLARADAANRYGRYWALVLGQ
jgi:uncharacterized protein YkwD